MKLSTNTNQYQTNITKAADFGIEDQDLSHIMGILRSQIYSDKLLAVIREYSTNAVDANIEAGNDHPIDVQLPTLENPVLSFRDFGHGLSDDEVCNLYVKYGASTKRSSNDYTGCLGIGCKAGFAYGDSFQVISYTKSHITTWLARIDESQRGTISMLNKQPNTNRATGTDVRVTIRKSDIEDCVSKANNFFKYWKNPPTCNLTLSKINIHESTDDWAICSSNSTSSYSRNYGGANLVMGNIRYPIDKNQLNITSNAGALIESNAIIFYAPVGCVDIAANRESLEYTDRTKNAIIAMTNNMLVDLVSRLTKHVASQPTRLQASIQSNKYNTVLPHAANTELKNQCKWNGLPLLHSIDFGTSNNVKCHTKEKSWRSSDNTYRNKSSDARATTLSPSTIFCVYDDSAINPANATRRIRTLQEQSDSPETDQYYVIPKSQLHQVTPNLMKEDYTDLMSVQPLKPKRTIISKTDGTTKKSVRINVCKLTPNTLKSSRLSSECEPTAMANGRYVYVPLDRFDWEGHGAWLDILYDIRNALDYLHAGENKPVIHGVKKHHVKNLDDKWITLDAYLAELFEQWRKANPDDAKLYANATSLNDLRLSREITPYLEDSTDLFIAKLMLAQETAQSNMRSTSNLWNMYETMITLEIIKRSDYFKKSAEIINQKYPLLNYIQIPYYLEDKAALKTSLHKYIQDQNQ